MSEVADQLKKQGFVLESTLGHNELIAFISEYLFRKNKITISYLIINFCLFILLIWNVVQTVYSGYYSFIEAFGYIIIGIFGTLLLVIPHEALHGLAYKICGANKVTYKANWKKLYFMAAADKFITTRNAFFFIALLPFFTITLLLLIIAYCSEPNYQIILIAATFVHATMCAGDFGLMSFFVLKPDKEMVTYDDLEKEESYFYSKNKKVHSNGYQ